ncbi:MAG: hypothetical protein ACOX7K_07175 [Oscillospiraceae bacterium]|jgi:hypothetical protein
MKKVYVFFFSTCFKTGAAIRFVTRNKYNHVAFSFAPNTKQLYSYARYRYHEPILSGFGIESTDRYAAGHTVEIRVCELAVSDERYEQIQQRIEYYTTIAPKTRYNFFDLLLYPIWHHHVELKYTHTCLSFLCEVLDIRGIHTISQLQRQLKANIVYEGPLSGFETEPSQGQVDFYERRNRAWVMAKNGLTLCGLAASLLKNWYHAI